MQWNVPQLGKLTTQHAERERETGSAVKSGADKLKFEREQTVSEMHVIKSKSVNKPNQLATNSFS